MKLNCSQIGEEDTAFWGVYEEGIIFELQNRASQRKERETQNPN